MALPDGEQHLLTDRQMEVLERIVQRKPYKLIADELDISETRIKQHVQAIKQRLDVNTMAEMVAAYPSIAGEPLESPAFSSGIGPKREVPRAGHLHAGMSANDPGAIHLADSLSMDLRAPWFAADEPQVVPGSLDGRNATLSRLLVIVAIMFGVLATIVLALTTANTLSEQLQGSGYTVPEKAS